jgi:putrescine transport system substrate-binding protein
MIARLTKNLLTAILTTFAVALAAASFTTQAPAQERVVNVYNWSDYIDPAVLEEFTKETGIKVRYDVFDSNDVLEARMLAGRSGYDIVVPSQTYLQRLIAAGVFQKLDKSKVPNLKHAWPAIAERLAKYDPGNEHAVNYMWGTTGIGINRARVEAALGGPVPESWDLVFTPELLGKVAGCGVHFLDAPDELIPTALHWMGLDADSKNPADIEKAGEALMRVRGHVRKFHRRNISTRSPTTRSALPSAGPAMCCNRPSARRRRRRKPAATCRRSNICCRSRARTCGSTASRSRRTR